MPVSLQQFFNSANTVGDSASLFLQNGGESVGDTSSLHGIHKLSRNAKAEENRATVTAFLNALDQSPQFRNINADIRGMLNAKLEGGKPLTAEDVKLVRDSVLYDEALAAGRQLADGTRFLPGTPPPSPSSRWSAIWISAVRRANVTPYGRIFARRSSHKMSVSSRSFPALERAARP